MSRARWTPLLALVVLLACDPGAVDPGVETSLVLQVWSESGVASVADDGRVHIEGPTNRTVSILPGETEVIDGLDPGAYTVALEGFIGGALESFGQTNVNVQAGQTATANINLINPFTPSTVNVADEVVAGQPLTVDFTPVTGADSYRIEWDDNAAFSSPQSTDVTGTSVEITIADPGMFHVRVSALNRFGSRGLPAVADQVQVSPPVIPLENGAPLPDRNGAGGSRTFYTFNVPAGPADRVLQIRVLGGAGNADLALRHESAPTLEEFDCASTNSGDAYDKMDFCSVQNPAQGTWHVMVYGQQAYDGVVLDGRLLQRRTLDAGAPLGGLSAEVGDVLYFGFDVPEAAPGGASPDVPSRVISGSEVLGTTSARAALPVRRQGRPVGALASGPQAVPGTLIVRTTGGTGDADLAAAPGAVPLGVSHLPELPCFPFLEGSEELCELSDPAAGSWTVLILAFEAFTDLSLAAEFERATFQLGVTATGDGHVGGGGIDCEFINGSESGTCSLAVDPGTEVTLAATPAPGFQFDGWGGDCTGGGGCTVTMSQDRTVHADFSTTNAAPVLSNPVSTIVEINSAQCNNGGTLRAISFDYLDADGDIDTEVTIDNTWTFQPSGNSGSTPQTVPRIGTASEGSLAAGYCTTWGDDTQITDVLSIRDLFGNRSNELTVVTPKPDGANAPAGAPGGASGPSRQSRGPGGGNR